jgi:hypothetical protein
MFFLLCTLVRKDNVYNKFYKITTYMQVNVIKWQRLILDKIRKKNHNIWSYYDREIPLTSFNCRLKRKTMVSVTNSTIQPILEYLYFTQCHLQMALSKTSRFYKKLGKRINRFGVHMRKKNSLQVLFED